MSKKNIIAIDFGGTNTRIALLSGDTLFIKAKTSFPTKHFFSQKNRLIAELVKRSFTLMREHHLQKSSIVGVGIGVPGLVDFAQGKVYYLPNVPHWENTALRRIVERRMHYPVFVDNDVNCMALAEAAFGAAKGCRNALCLTLGTGVGGGIILNGELFRGSRFCAGEIGHVPLTPNGPRCSCGGRGCLETYVGNKVLLKQARQKLKNPSISLEQVSQLADTGNRTAKKIYVDFARNVGITLSGAVTLLNPDCIVIGGGLSFAGDYIFEIIKQTIRERSMPVQAKAVVVKKAELGKDAGLIGAALLVKKNKSNKRY